MDFAWDRLPESLPESLPAPLLEGLCGGGAGKLHLLRLARMCLNAEADDRPDGGPNAGGDASRLRPLGLDLLSAAFEADPLDPELAGQFLALALDARSGPLGSALGALHSQARPTAATAATAKCEQLARRGDAQRAREATTAALREEPGNPRLLRLALDLAWQDGCAGWTAGLLEAPWAWGAEPLRSFALGNALFLHGDFERALAAYAAASALPFPTIGWRRGECQLRLGQREQALDTWRQCLRARPWNANLLLRAHDVAGGLDAAQRPLDGPLAVLLYTWNKASFLEATLTALFTSELAGARVFVLNNGSTDATATVLSAWQERVGPERLERIDLPVNVGAPAARNWLASLPGVRACRYAAFLDDDALPPPDWLGRLGAAVAAYPRAGVYGCKVVDAANPNRIQNADLHIRPGSGAEPKTEQPGNGLALSDLHMQEPDYGQFDYLRPCVSVTGCCHLFRTRVLAEAGGFDIALSPSQFDDLEHDLRLNLKGLPAAYQGHLRVGHARRTGEQGKTSPQAAANAFGNLAKIERSHSRRDIRDIARQDQARLVQDLRNKAKTLGIDADQATLRP